MGKKKKQTLAPEVGDVRYGYYLPTNRDGDLEFLCSTQAHMVMTQEDLLAEIKNLIDEYKYTDCDDTIKLGDIVCVEIKRINLDFPKSWPKKLKPY